MANKSKVGWLIPTNNPDALFSYFLRRIDLLRSDLFKLLIVFQPPWDEEGIQLFVKSCKMDIAYDFIQLGKNNAVSMVDLRNRCAMLDRGVDYYVIADDNFLFTRGTPQYPFDSLARYLHVIQYMDTFKKCGYVMCEGSLGGSLQKLKIQPTKSGLVSTQRGIFFRNIQKDFGNVWPDDSLHILGGCEETIVCYDLIAKGFFPAKQFNNPTQHKDKTAVVFGKNTGTIHCFDLLMKGAIQYVRNRFGDKNWTNDTRRFPAGLLKQYLLNGGMSEWVDGDYTKLTMDF